MLTKPALFLALPVALKAKENPQLSCSATIRLGHFHYQDMADDWMNALKGAVLKLDSPFEISFGEVTPSQGPNVTLDINVLEDFDIEELAQEFPTLVLRAMQREFDEL